MILLETPKEARAWAEAHRRANRTIGFVPTMGALHEGHASLMREAVARNNVAVASIFVNPTQFGPNEDYSKYPRTFEADQAMASKIGVEALYVPDARDMYPAGYATYVEVEGLTDGLCGRSRPGHFRGVTTVVAKLFNAVRPHRAYFGQKDAQQCAVLRRMTRDLDFGIEIIEMPIIRDPDGLALSSRNAYLSEEERDRALCLSRSLFAAQAQLQNGERAAHHLVDAVHKALQDVEVEYVELVDADSLVPVEGEITQPVLLAIAARVGTTRLIDNIKFVP